MGQIVFPIQCITCNIEVNNPFEIGIATVSKKDKVLCKKCFQEAQ
jgi:hypothetical protein